MPVCQADAEAGDPGCSPAVGQAGGAGALGVAGTGPTSAKPGCSEHVYNMSSITHVVCHPMGGLGRRQDAGRKKEAKRGKSGHHGGVRSGGRCRGNSHLLAEGWAREWACQRGRGGLSVGASPASSPSGLGFAWFGIRQDPSRPTSRPWVSWTGVIATGLGWQEEQRLCTAPGGHTDPPQCEPDVTPVSA